MLGSVTEESKKEISCKNEIHIREMKKTRLELRLRKFYSVNVYCVQYCFKYML